MPLLADIVVSASAMLFEAEVPTFGCTSGAEIVKLEAIRSDAIAFGQRLTEQVSYGQCVPIPQGAVVEGAADESSASTLLINAKTDPPGYRVPAADFRLKARSRTTDAH